MGWTTLGVSYRPLGPYFFLLIRASEGDEDRAPGREHGGEIGPGVAVGSRRQQRRQRHVETPPKGEVGGEGGRGQHGPTWEGASDRDNKPNKNQSNNQNNKQNNQQNNK